MFMKLFLRDTSPIIERWLPDEINLIYHEHLNGKMKISLRIQNLQDDLSLCLYILGTCQIFGENKIK